MVILGVHEDITASCERRAVGSVGFISDINTAHPVVVTSTFLFISKNSLRALK